MSHTLRAVPDRSQKPSVPGRRNRLTRNDQLVLDCLRHLNKPAKAYELLECLRGNGINAPMTVYRALTRLCEAGLVKKIESLNAFTALPEHDSDTFSAFLICQECGVTGHRSVSRQEVEALFGDVTIVDAAIEIRSKCTSALVCGRQRLDAVGS